MTITKIFASSLLAVAALAATASAETWQCSYTGTWTTEGSADSGEFTWVLQWESKAGGWHVIGDYSDRYGESTLDGTCSAKQCKLDQHYHSGQLDGKAYYWQGSYSDTVETKTRTTNKFSGTWGDGPNRRANGGKWSAKAVCKRTE